MIAAALAQQPAAATRPSLICSLPGNPAAITALWAMACPDHAFVGQLRCPVPAGEDDSDRVASTRGRRAGITSSPSASWAFVARVESADNSAFAIGTSAASAPWPWRFGKNTCFSDRGAAGQAENFLLTMPPALSSLRLPALSSRVCPPGNGNHRRHHRHAKLAALPHFSKLIRARALVGCGPGFPSATSRKQRSPHLTTNHHAFVLVLPASPRACVCLSWV